MHSRYAYLFVPLILAIDVGVLILQIPSLSISYHEAQFFYTTTPTPFSSLLHVLTTLFGQSDGVLRSFMLFLHVIGASLFYLFSDFYLTSFRDRLILLAIYLLIPGVLSSALIIDEVSLVIPLLLLFGYLYHKNEFASLVLMAPLAVVSPLFLYLYLGTLFYASSHKKYILGLYAFVLLTINLYLFRFDDGGLPTGHFLDALGLYAVVLSPVVFFYIVYVLYRRFLQNERTLLWYIVTTSLLFSLLLSFRQVIHVELYAPYLLLALPTSAKLFFNSYRVRLPQFRKGYKSVFNLSVVLLILNALSVFFNKELYLFLEEPSHHFAYRMHVAKKLQQRLKEHDITCIDAQDKQMQLRLRFYGIGACKRYILTSNAQDAFLHVTIRHRNSVLYDRYVSRSYN